MSYFRFLIALSMAAIPVAGADWRPIEPRELAQKTPRIEPSADAEAMFWDVRVEDRVQGSELSLVLSHYVRIKVYTERGKEQFGTVEIPQIGKRQTIDVAARTIKPDGSVVEMKKDAVFRKQLVKTKGLKMNGTTFALPNLEVGDILEYRYREVRDGEAADSMRLYFQREIPMYEVTYHLKPLNIPWLPYAMRMASFQCNLPPLVKEPNGFYSLTMTSVPGFHEEPNMPPEDAIRRWVLIYYEEDKKIDAEKYWKDLGRKDYAEFKQLIKPDGAVKKTANEIITGFDKPEDQLSVLDAYCRTKIKNWNLTAGEMNAAERKTLKPNRSPGDTLKQMAGTGMDIDFLFAAMASAIGLEARMARVPDRGDNFFSKHQPLTYFVRSRSVAVKVGGTWKFYDPSTPYLEEGMLRWQEEGVPALISDPQEGFFANTQFTEPARSMRKRRATLTLDEDGTLQGTVSYSYTGHVARGQKTRLDDMTAADQEKDWTQALQDRLSTAEVSKFTIESVTDQQKPLFVRHQVSVPGYATRTGKRILFQPAFFQRNIGARFTETERKHSVYFDYGWSEDDEVIIELPQGWELDQPVVPESAPFGHVGGYNVEVRKTTDGRKLIYRRQFTWGNAMNILIPPQSYPQIKKVFEFVHEQDGYTLTLRQGAGSK